MCWARPTGRTAEAPPLAQRSTWCAHGAAIVVVPSQTRLTICEALTQIAFGKAMGLHELDTLSAQEIDAMELAGKQLAEAASKGLVKVFGYLEGSASCKRISAARFKRPIHWQYTHDEFWHRGLWEEPHHERRVGQWTDVMIDAPSLAAWISNSPAKREETRPIREIPKRADTKKLHRAYSERVANWPKGAPPPSPKDDLEFLRTLHDGLSRDRARDIRRQLAPYRWKKGGRRKSGG